MRVDAKGGTSVVPNLRWILAGAVRCFWDPLAISRLVRRRAIAAQAGLAHGCMIDVGAGVQPYADLFRERVERIIAVEFPGPAPRARVDLFGDAQALPLRSGCADTVLCVEVLEYVPEPPRALREFARILRRGGRLLLTAPQIRGASNEPRDYWRFGHPGLRLLAREAGLDEIVINPCGGVFATAGQRLSSWLYATLAEAWGLPPRMIRLLCGAIQAPMWLADQAGIGSGETLHWLVTARKP